MAINPETMQGWCPVNLRSLRTGALLGYRPTIMSNRIWQWVAIALCAASITLWFGFTSYMTTANMNTGNQRDKLLIERQLKREPDFMKLESYVNRRLRYNQKNVTKHARGKHTILWWNEPNWMRGDKMNSELCTMALCEYQNCAISTDKRDFNKSSAVIYSVVKGESRHVKFSEVRDVMAKRNPEQAWVFFALESPAQLLNHEFESHEWQGVFNWSMTYRRDADVYLPYGTLVLRDKELRTTKDYEKIFRHKSKKVIWIVSHCKTHGKREIYVEELRKYIDVTIYGKCGKGFYPDSIFNIIGPQYKFYLAFENSLCQDYVTEKFFQYYNYDVINVVRGSADYDNALPNNTFINSAHFGSAKALGEFLIRLSSNEREYIAYLREKDRYKAMKLKDMYCEALCQLCEKVNNIDDNRNSYGNIFSWLGECHEPNDI